MILTWPAGGERTTTEVGKYVCNPCNMCYQMLDRRQFHGHWFLKISKNVCFCLECNHKIGLRTSVPIMFFFFFQIFNVYFCLLT